MSAQVRFSIGKLSVVLLVLLFLSAVPAAAQERVTDTLRVVGAAISPGDTGTVFVYIANSESLGGYTVRIAYDTSLIEVVTSPQVDSNVMAVQLRKKGTVCAFGRRSYGAVTGIGAYFSPNMLPAGSGNTVQLQFYAKPYAPRDTIAALTLADDPNFPQSFNWFTPPSGLGIYRPTRVSGSIWVGCDCAGLGDGNSDGQITSQEVIAMVNRVFRSYPDRMRELSRCPLQNGDWNCDGHLNPLDIVLLIGYVYGGPSQGPCDPCQK